MTATDLILQWCIAAIVGLVLFARGRLTLFHPAAIYLLFHAVAFCLRPTLIVAFDLDATWKSLHLPPDPDLLRRALWVSSAGLATFAAAFFVGTSRAPALRPANPPEMDRSDRRALLLTAAIFALPGLAAVGLARSATEYSGYILDLGTVLVPIALLAIVALQWRWWSLLPFAAVVALRAVGGHSPASTVLAAIVALLLLWLWSHQRNLPPLPLVVVGCVVAMGAVVVADHRSAIIDWLAGGEVPSAPDGTETTLVDRLDQRGLAHFEFLTDHIARAPESAGPFSYGSQHLDAWTDATPATARAGDRNRLAGSRGLPMSLVADGWLSGGWAGLLVTLGLAGLLLGVAFTAFARRQDDPAVVCLLATIQGLSLALYQAGDSTVVRGFLYAALPLLVWRFLAHRFRRAGAAEAERERLREERQRRRLLGTALLNPHAAPIPPGALASVDAANAPDLDGTSTESSVPTPRSESIPSLVPDPPARPPARWHGNEPH